MRIADLVTPHTTLTVASDVPPASLSAAVTGCAQSELIAPEPYLSPGEVLATHGMGLHVQDQRTWDAYIERIVTARVSALAFGLGPSHRTVPTGLVNACSRQSLPLLVLPEHYPLVKLSRHIWQGLEAERFATTRAGWELANELTRAVTEDEVLHQLLERIANHVCGTVRLVDAAGFTLARGEAQDSRTAPGARSTLRLPGAAHSNWELHIDQPEPSLLLQPLLGPACAVLSMHLSYTLTAAHPLHSHTAAQFFEGLLAGTPAPAGVLEQLATSAGFVPTDPWLLVTVRRESDTPHAHLRQVVLRLRVMLERHYERVRFFDELHHATLLVQAPRGALGLTDLLRNVTTDDGGLDVGHASGLRFDELALVLQAARRNHFHRGVHRLEAFTLRSLLGALPPSGLRPLARQTLAPVLHDEVLMKTLRSYLTHSGNNRAVADELFVHRNTLSHRLKRIQEALGTDLTDGRERAALLLALDALTL